MHRVVVYTVRTRRERRVHGTGCKHGRVQVTRLCTRPCSGYGRTMHGRVYGTYTAVHTGRKDGRRVHGTRPVHDRVYGTYTVGYGLRTRPCSGHGRTMCMARVRPPTAVYRLCTRPCTGHVHGPSVTVYTAVFTARVLDRPRPCTDCVHRRARATYMVRS